MGSGAGSSSSGASTSTGGASTSTGGVWAERRRDRIQSKKDLIRAMLDFDDEDDEGRFAASSRGWRSLSGRMWRMRMKSFAVAAVAAGIASSTTSAVFRRGGVKKTTEVSDLSTSDHAHSQPLSEHSAVPRSESGSHALINLTSSLKTLSEFHPQSCILLLALPYHR